MSNGTKCSYTNHYFTTYMGTVRPKSKQGNTTNLNISFSTENGEKKEKLR